MKLRLGTRGSRLALVQSELFAMRLRDAGHEVELVRIVTEGDVRSVDTVLLASAGVDRLGRGLRIDQRLEPKFITPAPAQGALAVQARRHDVDLLRVLAALDQRSVRLAVETEREVLKSTGGTCRAPVGALASVDGDSFTLLVAGVNSDGTGKRIETIGGACTEAIELAGDAGRRLVAEMTLR